jgi:hypothetical protein
MQSRMKPGISARFHFCAPGRTNMLKIMQGGLKPLRPSPRKF